MFLSSVGGQDSRDWTQRVQISHPSVVSVSSVILLTVTHLLFYCFFFLFVFCLFFCYPAALMTLGTSGFACHARLEHGRERTFQPEGSLLSFCDLQGFRQPSQQEDIEHLHWTAHCPPTDQSRPPQEERQPLHWSRQPQAKDKKYEVHT